MPNWVQNTLIVPKSKMHLIANKKGDVDFNLILPMPSSLDITTGSTNDYALYVYLSNRLTKPHQDVVNDPMSKLIHNMFSNNWLQEVHDRLLIENVTAPENKDQLEKYYEEGRTLIENYTKYGAITWYDWAVSNWGTKWNACESQIDYDYSDDECMCEFNTAWSPPNGWLAALASKNIKFSCEWIEEQGYHGIISSDGNGDIESKDLEMIRWDDEDDDYESETDENESDETNDE